MQQRSSNIPHLHKRLTELLLFQFLALSCLLYDKAMSSPARYLYKRKHCYFVGIFLFTIILCRHLLVYFCLLVYHYFILIFVSRFLFTCLPLFYARICWYIFVYLFTIFCMLIFVGIFLFTCLPLFCTKICWYISVYLFTILCMLVFVGIFLFTCLQ